MTTPTSNDPDSIFYDASDMESARPLADLWLTLTDLRYASDCLAALLEMEEDETESVVSRALWSMAIVAYARCFTSGVRERLSYTVFDELSLDGAREFHEHLIHFRNKFVAHSVNAFEDAKVGVSMSPDGDKIEGVAVLELVLVGRHRDELLDFRRLLSALITLLASRVVALQDQALAEAQRIGSAQFVDRAPMRLTAPGPDASGGSRRAGG